MTRSLQKAPSRTWRFGFVLLLQLAIVLAVPLPKAITRATGTSIALQTTPVDPYDILRGRYVTLGYAAEQISTLSNLPGWSDRPEGRSAQSVQPIYLILEPNPDAPSAVPVRAWHPVAVAWQYPRTSNASQRIIKGTYRDLYRPEVDLGLSQYFIPEERGDTLERDMNAHREATTVEIKLDRRGRSVLVRLWVEDRSY